MKSDIFLKNMAYIPFRIILIVSAKQTFKGLLKIKKKIKTEERKNLQIFQIHKIEEK